MSFPKRTRHASQISAQFYPGRPWKGEVEEGWAAGFTPRCSGPATSPGGFAAASSPPRGAVLPLGPLNASGIALLAFRSSLGQVNPSCFLVAVAALDNSSYVLLPLFPLPSVFFFSIRRYSILRYIALTLDKWVLKTRLREISNGQ